MVSKHRWIEPKHPKYCIKDRIFVGLLVVVVRAHLIKRKNESTRRRCRPLGKKLQRFIQMVMGPSFSLRQRKLECIHAIVVDRKWKGFIVLQKKLYARDHVLRLLHMVPRLVHLVDFLSCLFRNRVLVGEEHHYKNCHLVRLQSPEMFICLAILNATGSLHTSFPYL